MTAVKTCPGSTTDPSSTRSTEAGQISGCAYCKGEWHDDELNDGKIPIHVPVGEPVPEPPPVDNQPAYDLILACLKHEPPHQRGIVFSSVAAHEAIAAAGGQTREQLFGAKEGLLIRATAMVKLGDWTMTAAYERPATKEEARAEFDRVLAGMPESESTQQPPSTMCAEVGPGQGVYGDSALEAEPSSIEPA